MSDHPRSTRAALGVYRHLPAGVRRRLVRLWAPTFTVGAICAVLDGDHLLLVRQSYRRHWGAPGGLLDRGEAPEAAAVREVGEEAGLAIVLEGAAVPVVWPQRRQIDLAYRCRPAPGEDRDAVRASSAEILEARWFPLDALPTLQSDTAEALAVLGIVNRSPRRTPTAVPSERTGGAASSRPSPRSGGPAPG